ncbi:histidine kinase [Brucepastera parasyntrophica]|uniref:sensor histidine kinase n=1 Tax=Brucepastera parasyntrophica TaxID=2880008 RepID=UPI0021091E76|nr:histidine kinase [Brucepastera parasyntrophica]ULQ59259.1 histidine kinase [Brucepastera parasyntrophica]
MEYTLTNVVLELFSAAVLIILIVCQLSSTDKNTVPGRLFLLVLCLHTAVQLCDAVSWAFDGYPGIFFNVVMKSSNFLVYSLGVIDVAVLLLYISASIPGEKKLIRIIRFAAAVVVILFHVILIITQFNGMLYSITEQNVFRWGPHVWIVYAGSAVLFLMIIIVVLHHRKTLGRKNTVIFMTYVTVPTIALVINYLNLNLMLGQASIVLALLIIFVNIQTQRDKELKDKELKLMENQVAIMLSQIQPHFLFNSLHTIGALCDIDPKTAKETIIDFSSYLRHNLESLSRPGPIPFLDEMDHVKTYLSLEKKRFGKKLEIIYDITLTDFDIPSLALQPIVENAVRYGAAKQRQGGTVTIRTSATDEAWQVTVSDNGQGFDPTEIKKADGRSHIGIENVRSRLQLMCGGSLDISSAPGQGTTAVLSIPEFRNSRDLPAIKWKRK